MLMLKEDPTSFAAGEAHGLEREILLWSTMEVAVKY